MKRLYLHTKIWLKSTLFSGEEKKLFPPPSSLLNKLAIKNDVVTLIYIQLSGCMFYRKELKQHAILMFLDL